MTARALSFAGLIQSPLAEDLDRTFILDDQGKSWTLTEYRQFVQGAARILSERGIGRGTLVSWQLPTSFDALVLCGALAVIGATQNPILPLYGKRELAFIFDQCKPDVFIARDFRNCSDSTKKGGWVRPRFFHAPSGRFSSNADNDSRRMAGDDPDAVRWIFYSSGTTSAPKGVQHSDASLIAGGLTLAERFELTPDDRYGMTFPFAHVGGVQMLVAQLVSGASAILLEKFGGDRSFEALGAAGATLLAGGTPLAHLALEAQRRNDDRRLFPNLRAVMTGAAPKSPLLHAEIRKELAPEGSLSCYGLTEAPMSVLTRSDASDASKSVTEGTPIPGSAIRIVSASGALLPFGEVGEIRLKGPQVMKGYVDPALDAECFDADGFLRTGDLGSLDEAGNLRVVGRIKDIIIRKGEKISAAEIEDILATHPRIAEVAAIGVPAADAGERCCAVIKLREEGGSITLDEVADYCRSAGLASFKLPERLELVQDMPRGASGKILKTSLIERFASVPVVQQ